MKFTLITGETVTFRNGELSGDERLIAAIRSAVERKERCSCNYWAARPADLSSDWRAYLTICGTMSKVAGYEPSVDRVPANPDGYVPEGPVFDDEPIQASGHFLSVED